MREVSDDSGSGTITALGSIALLLTLTVAAMAVLSAVQAVHVARSAADLAALAAAVDHEEGGAAPCAEAARLAAAHRTTIESCTVGPAGVVDVTTSAPVALRLPGTGPARALGRARAGPVADER